MQTISASCWESLKIRLLYCKLVAFREEIRQVYSTEILSNTATIREVNMTEIDSTSKVLTEFTYDDFPCHLKVNRNKLVLINIIVDGSVKRAKDCR